MPLRRLAAVTMAAGLAAVAAGTGGLLLTGHPPPARRPAAVAAMPAPSGPIAAPPQAPAARPVARPVSVTIPAIRVSSRLVTLGLAPDGSVQVPAVTSAAGWYTGSPRPGTVGTAVIIGHIDSYRGPAVFYRLADVRPGDRVYVRRADATMVMFRVTAVRAYAKDRFPTRAVYGGTPDAELRLISCGGAFDAVTGHYLSNIVVYATQAG